MDQRLDLESGTIHELDNPAPGTWRFPTNSDLCCIYSVPNCMRHVNPEAYTPQFVLIGPLHHYLKSQSLKSRWDITNTKSMDYLNMERHKQFYLAEFAKGVEGEKIINGFRRKIKKSEGKIRASYSESTDWIKSTELVEMILHDSVFILELILRDSSRQAHEKIGDPLIDEPCHRHAVWRDLILLENQLPYFLLNQLFDGILVKVDKRLDPVVLSLRTLVTTFFFDSDTKTKDKSKFRHFTDLFRCIHVETLPSHFIGDFYNMMDMYHADKLHSGGVKFNVLDKEFSLNVEFKNSCLNIPCFLVDDHSEMKLRNIMALEQCHYAFSPHVCNYIWFLDFLIDTKKDVDLLVEKGNPFIVYRRLYVSVCVY